MDKGTGKPLPLSQVLLMFYEMGLKLKKPPDTTPTKENLQGGN